MKKLFMSLFAIALFMGLSSVKADEILEDVILDGTSIIPVVGSAPQTLTVPADAPYEIVAAESGWFNDDVSSRVESFTNGTTYVYLLELSPKEGNMFNADALLSITGLNWVFYDTSVNEDGFLTFLGHYTVASTPGVNHTIDGSLIRPLVGKTPASLELMLPEESPYEVQFETWFLDTDTPATPYTGNFVDGVGYGYAVAVCPKEGSGITFGANDTLTISGIPWKRFGSMAMSEEMFEGCMLAEARYKASMITIDEVELSGIVEPVAGNYPDHSTVTASTGLLFSISDDKDNGFYANKTDSSSLDFMTPFVEGDNVYFRLALITDNGYEFGENVIFKYEGETIDSSNVEFGSGIYTVYIPFTVMGASAAPEEETPEEGTPEEGETTTPVDETPIVPPVVTPELENPQTGDGITFNVVVAILSLIGTIGLAGYAKKRFN